MTVDEIVELYEMNEHPEGGYYKESYRSDVTLNTLRGERNLCTAIYFLITKDSISHFHKLTSDECWHFYMGSPLKLFEIFPDGCLKETIIGNDIRSGEKLQYIVPAGNYFASTSSGEYSLVGCTVSPGFDFNDFVMAKKKQLVKISPQNEKLISKYCLN